ncbi:MAG: NAD-dependent epimerase/dehydratase family protein [Deltaproteobacteria bacterium]|jgi:UDP-glucose 4-epimerase|nr:NAD-dependent epimerase/dehydratase family protein [Deltaproteobacteria bacterium]
MTKAFVTGAAGFIGSTLVDRLLAEGQQVIGYDNFSTGRLDFLAEALSNPSFKLVKADVLDPFALSAAMRGADVVWHFSANADVRFGLEHPRKDLEQNVVATSNVLEAMRHNGIRDILFSSTGSVYGEAVVFPTPEDAPFPIQTSLYAASKLAGEGLISSYCEGYDFRAVVFRFVSMLGQRYTHGHVFDFVRYLLKDPNRLPILGDGTQRKSYLHVGDCVEAMLTVGRSMPDSFAVYNLGADEYCTVRDSIGWITAKMGVSPKLEFSGGQRGWVGDNPFIFLDTKKIRALGWKNNLSIRQGVELTVSWLLENRSLLETGK